MFLLTNVTLFNNVLFKDADVGVLVIDTLGIDSTCTPLVVGLIIDAIALSSAACVDRLGVLSDIPWTLLVMLWVLVVIDWDGCGELGTWFILGLFIDVKAVHCLWLSPEKKNKTHSFLS